MARALVIRALDRDGGMGLAVFWAACFDEGGADLAMAGCVLLEEACAAL